MLNSPAVTYSGSRFQFPGGKIVKIFIDSIAMALREGFYVANVVPNMKQLHQSDDGGACLGQSLLCSSTNPPDLMKWL